MSAIPTVDNIRAKRGAFHDIPVIDFAPAFSKDLDERKRLAVRIHDACVRVGFFYVKNHAVDDSVMENVFGAAKHFFDLPIPS
jgi:isopenicillin N synthase-like dioxygenase